MGAHGSPRDVARESPCEPMSLPIGKRSWAPMGIHAHPLEPMGTHVLALADKSSTLFLETSNHDTGVVSSPIMPQILLDGAYLGNHWSD